MELSATWPSPIVTRLDALLVWLDGAVCSQAPGHSFWLAGQQLPLCARDLGLFGAFLLVLPFVRGAGQLRWLWGLGPLIIDGANSFVFDELGWAWYTPANGWRLATGIMAGISLAIVLAPAVRRTAGHLATPRRIPSVPSLPLALFAAAVAWLAGPYPAVALLGTAGILALIAHANLLARPALSTPLAWALALPELALLAAAKDGLLAALR